MKLLATLMSLAVAALAAPGSETESQVSYNGFKAVRIATEKNPAAIENQLGSLRVTRLNVDTSDHMDIAVGPDELEAFEKLAVNYEVIFEDMGDEISKEGPLAPYESAPAGSMPSIAWFDNYHAYADHIQFMKDLQAAFPNNSETITAGTSYQGRDLYGIHLWGKGGKGKPAIYFHGTVHAREWISPMVVQYLTYQLIAGYGSDPEATKVLDTYDFFILPIVNPDGFVFTQTGDRLWRKNRMPRSGSSCIGTDVNRNWPHPQWSAPGGASTNMCSETYKGESAGDTAEMKGLSVFSQKIAKSNGIKLFIDWHSYGQYILIPYGYDCSVKAQNHNTQISLARNTAQFILKEYGSSFTYGQACSTLYATTGDSTDYIQDVAHAEFAWTIELRPGGSGGTGGFILPADQILPAGIEQWDAMMYLIPEV